MTIPHTTECLHCGMPGHTAAECAAGECGGALPYALSGGGGVRATFDPPPVRGGAARGPASDEEEEEEVLLEGEEDEDRPEELVDEPDEGEDLEGEDTGSDGEPARAKKLAAAEEAEVYDEAGAGGEGGESHPHRHHAPVTRIDELERELRRERERERELPARRHHETPPAVLTSIRASLLHAQNFLRENRSMENMTRARLAGLHIEKLGAKKEQAVLRMQDTHSLDRELVQPPLVYVIKHPHKHYARIHFEALGLGKRTQTFAVKIDDLRKFLFPAKKRNAKTLWDQYWSMVPETEPQNEYLAVNCLYFIHYGDQGGTVQFDETKPWEKCRDTKKHEEYEFPYRRWSSVPKCEGYRTTNLALHIKKRYFQLLRRVELEAEAFSEFHKHIDRDLPLQHSMAQVDAKLGQVREHIAEVFRQHKIDGRDYFAWFRRHETRLVNQRDRVLHRQIHDQNEQVHAMQQRIHDLERQIQIQQQQHAPAAPPAVPVAATSWEATQVS